VYPLIVVEEGMEDSQPAKENGRGVEKKNMNSNANVMYYTFVSCMMYHVMLLSCLLVH
jgi:hypothetical protein